MKLFISFRERWFKIPFFLYLESLLVISMHFENLHARFTILSTWLYF